MRDAILIAMLTTEQGWTEGMIFEAHKEARGATFDHNGFRAGVDSSHYRELTPEEVEKYLAWKKSQKPTLESI